TEAFPTTNFSLNFEPYELNIHRVTPMHRLLILLLTLALSTTVLAGPTDHNPILVERAKHATALLYSQAENGGMAMRCTATAFAKSSTGYDFVTAAHCV